MAMLYERFMTLCVVETKTCSSDGEGGSVTSWSDGDSFYAALVLDNSSKDRIADKDTTRDVYTVTAEIGSSVKFGDVFRRASDGKRFLVISDGSDSHTPDFATMSFRQMKAQEWERDDV